MRVRERVAAVPTDRVQLLLMLALTFGTGLVDAVGYLGLDRVFVGNMTGNVVILGMGLGGGDDLPVLGPALALAGFVVGAAAGGRALRRVDDPWRRRAPHLLGVVSLAVVVAAVVVAGAPSDAPGLVVGVGTGLGAAMGLQAATARRVAVADVTTVVVTSTLTGLAADSALGGGEPGRTARRLAAVALLLLGALVGALLVRSGPAGVATGLLMEAGLVATVALAALLHARATRRSAGATPEFRS